MPYQTPYRAANERDRRSLNSAVFERIEVRGGEMAEVKYQPPFDQLLGLRKFEYGGMERETGLECPSTKPPIEFVYRLN